MIKMDHMFDNRRSLKKEFPKVHLKEQPEFQGEQLSEYAKECNNNCPVPKLSKWNSNKNAKGVVR